jgi:Protein tyrosine and serine/threonine kinase
MRPPPPPDLVDLLTRLGLALPGEVRGMWGRVRRLARDLPAFESVWVDALAQARKLTPFQAVQINAGLGERLAVGPYVLAAPLPGPAYAASYRAGQRVSAGEAHLVVIPPTGREPSEMLVQVESLIRQSAAIDDPTILAVAQCGLDENSLWIACALVDGVTAQQWMVHNGRFPPNAVLEIARQMAAGLAACERAGIVHGDLAAGQVWLDRRIRQGHGGVRLPAAGLRAIVRPQEGFTEANLDPAAYDGLAPERIRDGTPPDCASDLFASGCLWWHLLTGRPPLAGATALAKMRGSLSGKIVDVRELAPDAPQPLAEAIAACTQRDPLARPESFALLAERLGPPTRPGAAALARCLQEGARPIALSNEKLRPLRPARWPLPSRVRRPARIRPLSTLAGGGALLILAVATWPLWKPPVAGQALTAGNSVPGDRATVLRRAPKPTGALLETAGSTLRPVAHGQPLPQRTESRRVAAGAAAAQNAEQVTGGRGSIVLATATAPPQAAAGEPHGEPTGVPRYRAELVLPAGRAVAWTDVRLRAGQVVRGPAGKRATVLVPHRGAKVDVEDVRIENVDFVFSGAATGGDIAAMARDEPDGPSVVHVSAYHCEFHGCTFRADVMPRRQPAAILWRLPPTADSGPAPLRGGQLQLTDCVMTDVAAGVRCQGSGSQNSGGQGSGLSIELTNVLHLGPGPLASLEGWPRVGETVAVRLQHSTLRGASGLVECRYDEVPSHAGRIRIEASNSVLVPETARGLVVLLGDANPASLLSAIELSGDDSVLARETPLIEWRETDGRSHVATGGEVSSPGLVRCDVEFKGASEGSPAASRVVGWQTLLRSAEPPGIGNIPLQWPAPPGR